MTIDSDHNNAIFNIKKNKTELNTKISELENALKTEKDEFKKILLKNKISDIKKELENCSIEKYYQNNATDLFKHYDALVDVDQNEIIENKGKILNFFSNKEEVDNDDEEIKKVNECCSEYVCKACGSSNLLFISSESVYECTSCGNVQNSTDWSNNISYRDPPKETSYFSYRRVNHFSEWLNLVQGKETNSIPNEVIQKVVETIKRDRKQISDVTISDLKLILKRNKFNKYYENSPYIHNVINKKFTSILTRKQEVILKDMFSKIQVPFLKACPESRKNFLSYSFILHKFCEILEWNDIKRKFPLLKSREKLHSADLIWKKICNELNWKFYKSI